MSRNQSPNELHKGKCPDERCGNLCYFPADQEVVECKKCGQIHDKESLLEKAQKLSVEDMQKAFVNSSKRGPKDVEAVKVNGLSNYQCKLISSLMTVYGLDRESGSAKLLSSMQGNNDTFDCSKLSNKAFVIDEKHLGIKGYGIDPAAQIYLSSVLDKIKTYNNCKRYPLVPIHADGDGHCLVHALSRCLVGRELFWHPLMTNLKTELTVNLDKYQMQFADFIEDSEWERIVAEADPCFEPIEGEPTGLRNMHIFALANVLHRPIILLDSIDGLQSFADYSGLFLPVFVPPENCIEKDGTQNKPLVISWSNKGRNHFVSLVGMKNENVCRLPGSLLPKVWGGFQDSISNYLDLSDDNSCIIAGNNTIKDSYIQEIVSCMEGKFKELNNVSALIVADFYHHTIKPFGKINTHYKETIDEARKAIEEETLHKCISCGSMVNYEVWDEQINALYRGGELYQIAVNKHKILQDGMKYYFPQHNVTCRYDGVKGRLFFHFNEVCQYCSRDTRLVDFDGLIKYRNGDCVQDSGNKIFWDGYLYDYLPEKFEVDLSWKDNFVQENVFWFYKEKDPSRNSNAFDIAHKLVQKHYPLEFGSNALVQKVLDQILQKTAHLKSDYAMQDLHLLPLESAANETAITGETYGKQKLENPPINSEEAKDTKKKTEKKKIQNPRKSVPAKSQVSQKETPSALTTKKQDLSTTKSIIRISAKGKNSTIDLPQYMTYSQLQEEIKENLGIPCENQQIKIGFPPKLIKPPENETEPLPLKHGDRVLVEEITKHDKNANDFGSQNQTSQQKETVKVTEVKKQKRQVKKKEKPKEDKDISWGTLNAIANQEADWWRRFASKQDWFRRGGIIFGLIESDYGVLNDGDHLSLPYFPNKVLCYNASSDEMQLCLGDRHIPVQPLTKKDLDAASRQMAKYNSVSSEPKCNVVRSGRKASDSNSGVRPFSGHGQTLGTSANESYGHGQALGTFANESYGHGQELGTSVNKSYGHGQALGTSVANEGYGQGQALGTSAANESYGHGQALGTSPNESCGHGQALGNSANESCGHGQALGTSAANEGYGQGQALGTSVNKSYSHGQALGTSAANEGYGQGQALETSAANESYGHGQGLGTSANESCGHGQALGNSANESHDKLNATKDQLTNEATNDASDNQAVLAISPEEVKNKTERVESGMESHYYEDQKDDSGIVPDSSLFLPVDSTEELENLGKEVNCCNPTQEKKGKHFSEEEQGR